MRALALLRGVGKLGRRTIIAGLIGIVVISVAVASAEPDSRLLPPPSSTTSTAPTVPTTVPDYSGIPLEPVPGETTTTLPITVGDATLRGTVQGPDGPVPGAIVRADRLVSTGMQRTEVRTAADGTFTMAKIPGGRFRVRAFLPPTLAMDDAEVFFLDDGEVRDMRLVVQPFTGVVVRAGTRPSAPIVGQGVNLALRVADRTVDSDGVAREVPRPNESVIVTSSGWTAVGDSGGADRANGGSFGISSASSGVTDSNGIAVFEYRCDRVGSVSASATVGADQQVFPLDPPPCAPVPTTTTTTTTTTTVPGGSSSSTSTTEASDG